MSFTDPVAVTDAGTAKTLPRTGTSANASTYRLVATNGDILQLVLSHETTKGQRERVVARITRTALVSNPLVSGQSRAAQQTITLTSDRDPLQTPADAQVLYATLLTFLTSAAFLRLAAGET